MKITNYEKKGDVIRFNASKVTLRLLNTLRRTIISGIPVMAMEKITIYNNSSILNDEYIAHRLGLMPLKSDIKTYNTRDKCTCKHEGCGKCTAILSIDVAGPKTVYSGDIKSTDPNIVPVYNTIPLVKIKAGQKLKLEAEAVLGYGKQHIKWQPGLAAYTENENEFEFMAESYGQYTTEDLIKHAFKEVDEKIKTLKQDLKIK